MRILNVGAGSLEEVDWARSVIEDAVGHPSKTVMLVWGDGPEVARLADRAGTRSDPFPWREVLWIPEPEIVFTEDQQELWMADKPWTAVVLGFDDEPVYYLTAEAGLLDIEQVFLEAERGA